MAKKIEYVEDHFPGHSNNQASCLACHSVHKPATPGFLRKEPNRLCSGCHGEIAAQFTLRSRHPLKPEGIGNTFSIREGKVGCLDCHSSTQSPSDWPEAHIRLGKCQECHPNTRGPFLFPHDAGSREISSGCITCHAPHGSPNRHLLKAFDRGLCLSCHTDEAVGHHSGASCTTSGCHVEIHGSNRSQYFLKP